MGTPALYLAIRQIGFFILVLDCFYRHQPWHDFTDIRVFIAMGTRGSTALLLAAVCAVTPARISQGAAVIHTRITDRKKNQLPIRTRSN